jgi:hypothetical protein
MPLPQHLKTPPETKTPPEKGKGRRANAGHKERQIKMASNISATGAAQDRATRLVVAQLQVLRGWCDKLLSDPETRAELVALARRELEEQRQQDAADLASHPDN